MVTGVLLIVYWAIPRTLFSLGGLASDFVCLLTKCSAILIAFAKRCLGSFEYVWFCKCKQRHRWFPVVKMLSSIHWTFKQVLMHTLGVSRLQAYLGPPLELCFHGRDPPHTVSVLQALSKMCFFICDLILICNTILLDELSYQANQVHSFPMLVIILKSDKHICVYDTLK